MRSTLASFVCFALIVVLGVCSVLPHPSTAAAPPPPPPGVRQQPSDAFHGWIISDVATDPNRGLTYIIDSSNGIVAVNFSRGEVERSLYYPSHSHSLFSLAVDSRSRLVVTAWSHDDGGHLRQYDDAMQLVRIASLDKLEPPLTVASQVVTDSSGFIYLFMMNFFPSQPSPARVWVLDGNTGQQVDSWEAPIAFSTSRENRTDYILAIDGSDTLYFQQTAWEQKTFLVSTGGQTVDQWNLLRDPQRPDQSPISDIAIDSRLVFHVVRAGGDGAVQRWDAKGRRLPPLDVLSGDSFDWTGPQLAVDDGGRLQVTDPFQQQILQLSDDGDIRRAVTSRSASLLAVVELLQDAQTGDLILSDMASPVIAQRVSRHDGSLIQQYSLPSRLMRQRGCESVGLDVGSRHSRLYVLLVCGDDRDWHILVHVMSSSGQVVSEFRLPFRQVQRIRVDEWADRVYIPSIPEGGDRGSTVQIYTLDGRYVMNISLDIRPALRSLADLVIDPDTHGIVLLDSEHHRIIRLAANGTLEQIHQLGDRAIDVVDLAFGERGNVLYSVLETYQFNSSFAHNSSIVELDANGTVVETFVGFGDPVRDGPDFGAIAVGRDGQLFAFDLSDQAVFVWEHHPHPPHADIQPSQPALTFSHAGGTPSSLIRHQRLKASRTERTAA